MPKMQTANCMLALAGDLGNTVPKYGVTVAEIVVLQHVHGAGSVRDIEPIEEIERSHAEEHTRLKELFPRPDRTPSPVGQVYPGSVAVVHCRFDETDIGEDCFKAKVRVSRETPAASTEAAKPVRQPRGGRKQASAAPAGDAQGGGSDDPLFG